MARKLSALSVFIAASTVVLLSGWEVSAQQRDPHTFYRTTIAGLNDVLALTPQQEGGQQFTLAAGDSVYLTTALNQSYRPDILSSPYIAVSKEAMTGTAAALAYNLEVNKTGIGLWRLDQVSTALANQSNLWATANNQFNISQGTLELMRGSNITLQGTAATTQFTLRNNTALNARGSMANGIDGGGTAYNKITAANIQIQNNVSLGFDTSNYVPDGQPILQLDGNVVLNPAAGEGKLNLLGFKTLEDNNTLLRLLQYNYTGTVPTPANPPVPNAPTYAPPPIQAYYTDAGGVRREVGQPNGGAVPTYPGNFEVQIRGETWGAVAATGRIRGNIVQSVPAAATGGTIDIRIENFQSYVGQSTWAGGSGHWDATSQNWYGYIANYGNTNTFLHGDFAIFGGTTGLETIAVQAGGVQIGKNSNHSLSNLYDENTGMVVNAGTYIFRNDAGIIGIDGPGGVIITNGASVTFESANSYWGGTIVENSNLTLGNSGAVGTESLELKTGAALTFATIEPNDNFYNTIITENGTKIYKDKDNTLKICNFVTGNADTTIHEGTLQKHIGHGVLTIFKGATYDISTDNDITSQTIKGLSDRLPSDPIEELPNPNPPYATVELRNHALYINVGAGEEYAFSGLINGTNVANNEAQVVKHGLGTQVFVNADNTYSGGTQIEAGTLVGRHVLDQDIMFHPFGTGSIQIDKNALLQFDLQRDIADLNPNLYVATVNNTITGAGDLEMKDDFNIDSGFGSTEILYLTADNSDYTGKTAINGGKIRIRSINSTGKTSEVAIQKDSALQFNEMTDTANTTPYDRLITGEGDVEVLENTIVYVRGFNDGQPELNSSYTGKTLVEQNVQLHLLDVTATGKTNIVDLRTSTSDLYLDFASQKEENIRQEAEQIYDRYIHGDGNLIKTDKGTAVLALESATSPHNDYFGTTTVTDGTLKLMYADATGVADRVGDQSVTIVQNTNGTGILELAFDGDYNKGITGGGILAKSGVGTTTRLLGRSDYSGGTYIYGGTLSYSSLDVDTPGNLGSGGVEFKRGGGILQNRETVESFDQRTVIDGGSTATFDTSKNLTVTGSNGIMHNALDSTDPYYNANDPQSHFVKTGNAVMTINTMTAWTGTTTVKQGVLVNNIPTNTALTVETGSTYRTGNAPRQVSSLWGGGNVELEGNNNFTVNYNGTENDVFDGHITGPGNLIKTGNGTFILTGINDYSGTTLVETGTLIGNIANLTDLTVNGEYQAGSFNREIGSLQGSGTVNMQGKNLIITQKRFGSPSPMFTGKIINGNQLIKEGEGEQRLGGVNYKFTDDINVNAGTLHIGGNGSLPTYFATDQNLNVKETATLFLDSLATIDIEKNLKIDGTLDIVTNHSSILTGSATFGAKSVLNISGIGVNDEKILLIKSDTAIWDNFSKVTVAGSPEPEQDFLFIGVTKSDDKKELYVGQSLRWYATADKAHGNFTLNNPDAGYTIHETLRDVTGPFESGWDGKTLNKKGIGTLILGAANTYTGATNVEGGTLKLINEQATAGSEKINLKNNLTTLEIDFDSRNADGSWSKGLMTPITGSGELVKTGYTSTSVLGGRNTYTGDTNVLQGALLVDGSLNSRVWVRKDAGFGGNGTVHNMVNFEDGSYYYWRFGATPEDSDTLTVNGSVFIGENVIFKPVATVSKANWNTFYNAVVLESDEVYGKFAGIDASSNALFDFSLNYDNPGLVTVNGYLRKEPRALSDIVPTSLMLAQTKMYRTAFQQITREWQSECPLHVQGPQVRGQAPQATHSAWMSFVGRGDNYESSFDQFKDGFNLQSYGVQAGASLISNCTQNFGFLFGREEGKLSNYSDKVENEDYYLGFYYAHKFFDDHDIRAYIGGGWQKNDLLRTNSGNRYASRYNGNTFNLNAEFGRRYYARNNWSVRLLSGFDVEVRRIGGSMENSLDVKDAVDYRYYNSSELSRVFIRGGIEANKTWRRIDFRAGTQIGWNFGDTRPETRIYYPDPSLADMYVRPDVLGSGAHLGRLEWWLNVGMDWYLTDRRNTFFFLDYNGDVYLDRDGDTSAGTGNVGFCWRF